MAQYDTLKNRLQEIRLFRSRLLMTAALICVLVIILIIQLFNLQVSQYRYYKTLSTNNQIDLIPISPRRGLIYDRNNVLLAQNIPVFSLMIMPGKSDDLDKTISELCQFISITPTDLEQFSKQRKLFRRFEYIPLKIRLTDKEVARFAVNSYRFPSARIETQLLRYYPLNEIMTPVLGYVGRINERELMKVDNSNYAATNFIGKLGIEKHYEPLLHGTVGYQKIETDASGTIVRRLDRIPPIAGNDIQLTIDSKLQAAAQAALGNNRGSVVVIQPATGEVLALVSNPTYNPNLFVNGISQKDYNLLRNDPRHPLFNRALRGLYPPASIVKPFLGLEGLNANITTNSFQLFDPGWYKFPTSSHIFHDWKQHGHGWVNLSKAIIESVDTYFYDLAYKMGIDHIDKVLTDFGFGNFTGIDIDEELAGNIPTPEWKMKNRGRSWYPADTILSGIGQAYMQVTPMQLAYAIATLSERGIRFTPHLIKTKNGIPVSLNSESPIILNKEKYWSIVINAMQQVITRGTGHRFGKTSYSVAAKTGTAQVVNTSADEDNEKGIPISHRNNSVFIAFAPIDKPEIAVSVVIENNHVAPLVARKVMDYYFIDEKREEAKIAKEKDHATG